MESLSPSIESSTVQELFSATVKSVLSGDTLQLVSFREGGPPREITLTLASLQAPKLARGPQQSDDPFAWPSRDFLRKMVIGKPVQFSILYSAPQIGRTFGDVFLANPSDGSRLNISLAVVAAGWAAAKESNANGNGNSNSADYSQLLALDNQAKALGIGIHQRCSTESERRQAIVDRKVNWTPTRTEVEDIFARYKGCPVLAVIEFVRDGGSVRCLLLDQIRTNGSATVVTLTLAGISCPRANTTSTSASASASAVAEEGKSGDNPSNASSSSSSSLSSPSPEPYALQARQFTEMRLLNREIQVVFLGIDSRSGNLLGSVLHPKGNIAAEVLRSGFGRVAEWSLPLVAKDAAVLRTAELEAKEARRGVWQCYQPPVSVSRPNSHLHRSFEGVVVEVVSGDTVVVSEAGPIGDDQQNDLSTGALPELNSFAFTPGENRTETKVTIGGIRVPKLGHHKTGLGEEPLAQEAKEFLRARLIGKKVSVQVDYVRSASNANVKLFCSLRLLSQSSSSNVGSSVGAMVLSEGFGTVYRVNSSKIGAGNDAPEERPSDYDILLLAESNAIAQGKGVHDAQQAKDSEIKKLVDLSTDSKKMRSFFSLLQKGKPLRAQVEYVFSGSRFKLSIPSENCLILLSLSQVRSPYPKSAGKGSEADPYGEEARSFSKAILMQRTVEVELDDLDRSGQGAIGRLYLPGHSPANALLPKALASASTSGGGGSRQGQGQGQERFPYSLALVASGLARTDRSLSSKSQPSAPRSYELEREATRLIDTQTIAKENRWGIWSVEDFSDGADKDGAEDGSEDGGEATEEGTHADSNSGNRQISLTAKVCEIVDARTFFVHALHPSKLLGDSLVKLEEVTKALEQFGELVIEKGDSAFAVPSCKKGLLCLAPYTDTDSTEDSPAKSYCRVRIEEICDGDANLLYLDYGTRASIAAEKLLAVSAEDPFYSTLWGIPAQAVECELAFLSPSGLSPDTDLGEQAGCFLSEQVWGKDVTLRLVLLNVDSGSSYDHEREKNNFVKGKSGRGGQAKGNKPSEPTTNRSLLQIRKVSAIAYRLEANPDSQETSASTSEGAFPDGDPRPSINELLLNEGLSRISKTELRRYRRWRVSSLSSSKTSRTLDQTAQAEIAVILPKLQEAQELAHREHRNLWAYGDPGDSDD